MRDVNFCESTTVKVSVEVYQPVTKRFDVFMKFESSVEAKGICPLLTISYLELNLSMSGVFFAYCSVPCEQEPSAFSAGCRPCDTHQEVEGRKEDLERENISV